MWRGTLGAPATLGSQTEGLLYLPPRESVDVTLRFLPPSESGAPTPPADAPADADRHFTGQLLAHFTNGEAQALALSASVLRPVLVVDRASLEFGSVHPRAPKPLTVVLANNALVDCAWAVVPAGAPVPRAELEALLRDAPPPATPANMSMTATAGAFVAAAATGGAAGDGNSARVGDFVVTPARGVLQGRGLNMPRRQRVTVTFAPSDNRAHSAALNFVVLRGDGCMVSVHGTGTFDETLEHNAHLNAGL